MNLASHSSQGPGIRPKRPMAPCKTRLLTMSPQFLQSFRRVSSLSLVSQTRNLVTRPESLNTATKLTYSSVIGPTTPPPSDNTLYGHFTSEVLAKYPSRPALICRTERPGAHGGPASRMRNLAKEGGIERNYLAWDYEEFNRHIMALARGLIGLGVQKGDRVAVVMGNNRYESE